MLLTVQDYIDGLIEGKIFGSKCNKCNQIMIPIKPVCSKCGNFSVEKFKTKGKGFLKNFTIIYVAPEKFKDKVPYAVGLIQIDEGGLIMGRLVGVSPDKPENIKIGSKVKFELLVENENEKVIVVFRVIDINKAE